jgi:hypothetical protein
MADIREAIVRSISRAIHGGEPIPIHSYNPEPPVTADDTVKDAIIKNTLNAVQEGRVPAFSGTTNDQTLETPTK